MVDQLRALALGLCVVVTGSDSDLGARTQASCPTQRRETERLTLAGQETVYVEPMTFTSASGSTLVAGEPVFVWQPGGAPRRLVDSGGQALGIVRGANGRVTLVPRPAVPDRLTDIRVAAGGADGYAVVFAQVDTARRHGAPEPVIDYWFGLTDGARWQGLERLPRPRDGSLQSDGASDLVRIGDSLLVAVPVARAGSGTDVALYTRSGKTWSLEVLPTGLTAYVAVSTDEAGRPLLVVVRPDRTRRDRNNISLFVQVRGRWTNQGFVYPAEHSPAYDPRITTVGEARILSWIEQADGKNVARAARVSQGRLSAPIVTIASDIEEMTPVARRSELPLWVVSIFPSQGRPGVLRLVEWQAGGPRIRDEVVNPFQGALIATVSPGGVTVQGAGVPSSPADEPVVSRLVQLRLRCN